MNIYLDKLNITDATITTLTTTNTTTSDLLVANTIINNTQSYGILRGSTTQSIPTATPTEMTSYFTGGTNVVSGYITNPSNGRLQVSKTGVYLCNAQISWSNATISERACWFHINGSTASYLAESRSNATAGSGTCQTISTCLLLTANDYVSVWGSQSSGGSLGQDTGLVAMFSMCRSL